MSMNSRCCCGTHSITCNRPDGSAVWLRLSTRQLAQPERRIDAASVIAGGHWVVPPADGARIAVGYQGPVAAEAEAAFAELRMEEPGAGLLAITSPDRLHAGWLAAGRARRCGDRSASSHIERLLAPLADRAALVTVVDGILPRMRGWGRCGVIVLSRLGRTGLVRVAIFRICITLMVSTQMRFWMRARRRCWRPTSLGAECSRNSDAFNSVCLGAQANAIGGTGVARAEVGVALDAWVHVSPHQRRKEKP